MAVKIGAELKNTIDSWVSCAEKETVGEANFRDSNNVVQANQFEAMLQNLIKEKNVPISSARELEVFHGVFIKQRSKASSQKKVEGVLVLTSAYMVFYCSDRTLSHFDQVIPLAKIEATKVRPGKNYVVGRAECCLKITVAEV